MYDRDKQQLWKWIIDKKSGHRSKIDRRKALKLLRTGKVLLNAVVVNDPDAMYTEFEVKTLCVRR